jgi:hypothetical protein
MPRSLKIAKPMNMKSMAHTNRASKIVEHLKLNTTKPKIYAERVANHLVFTMHQTSIIYVPETPLKSDDLDSR